MQDFNQKRRMDIKPILNKDFGGICTDSNPTTEWLFGDNLPEQLKNSRATANVVRSTMKSSMSGNRYAPYFARGQFKSLNWRGTPHSRGGNQFRRTQFQQRGRRYFNNNNHQQQKQ